MHIKTKLKILRMIFLACFYLLLQLNGSSHIKTYCFVLKRFQNPDLPGFLLVLLRFFTPLLSPVVVSFFSLMKDRHTLKTPDP